MSKVSTYMAYLGMEQVVERCARLGLKAEAGTYLFPTSWSTGNSVYISLEEEHHEGSAEERRERADALVAAYPDGKVEIDHVYDDRYDLVVRGELTTGLVYRIRFGQAPKPTTED